MNASLDSVFYPKSLAIVGASPGKSGQLFLNSVLASNFKGRVYPINSTGQEISGLTAYVNIKDVPGSVDYVVCCIPSPAVPQLIRDCAEKGVRAVSIFTAGFSEIGTEEGRELEKEISRLAKAGGVRIIGPNCLGVYSPKIGLAFASDFPLDSGRVALICQSGGNFAYLSRAAAYRGVRYSKAISYGNACDINECDLLEYFCGDDETDIIGVYIEGVKEGRRFSRALRELARVKPVVVLKGGHSEAGVRTAASHTGSLAGSDQVWDELLRQTGAIRVYSLEEMVDMLVTLSFLPDVRGRKVCILGGGGGASVLATDDWADYGFVLPPLPAVVRDEIRSSVPTEAGLILGNPLDLSGFAYSDSFYDLTRRLIAHEGFVDLSVLHIGLGMAFWFSAETFGDEIDAFRDAMMRIGNGTHRPLAVVMQYSVTGWDWQKGVEDIQKGCAAAGLPVYHSMSSAARAIDRLLRYHEKQAAAGDSG
ncbi:acetate--CoA ligase family protein [Chloroflexota bacterium]